MAFNLTTSSSLSGSQDFVPFCTSLSPSHLLQLRPPTLNFPLRMHSKQPSGLIVHISLQEQTQTSNSGISQRPDENTSSSSKRYIWVNPQSSRASQLRENSYDFRYSYLLKIARSLDSCTAGGADIFCILESLGGKITAADAIIVLNNMLNPKTVQFVLRYFLEKVKLSNEVVLYNVTLKVFRKRNDFDKAEKLFDEMIKMGVKPDNVTFLTMISCARTCYLPEKAVEWFEKMPFFGCEPNGLTSSLMIDPYGKVGNKVMALFLYDRARTEKWPLDARSFETVIRIYSTSGNYDGCLNVYEEMKELGVRPTFTVYNILLVAMGRAKRSWQAKNIYKEMLSSGFHPNWRTYTALLQAFCRARSGEDALNVYREMKKKRLELSVELFNALLSMCADVGFADEAVEIFADMKNSGNCIPDSWTYSSMIDIFSGSGKAIEAEQILGKMLREGIQPSIHVLTLLIQCYGKANRTDDVVRTFDWLLELGMTPDERFCGSLLNVMTQIKREELGKLTSCIENGNPKLGHVVKLLIESEKVEGEIIKKEAGQLFNDIGADVRKAYCNFLIDLCVNLNQLERACELLDVGLTLEIYTEVQSRTLTQWSLRLHSLSLGAALIALHLWMNDLSRALENGEELPLLLGIYTGHTKYRYPKKSLAGTVEPHLKELKAPFQETPDKPGWFLTTRDAAKSWLESGRPRDVAAS